MALSIILLKVVLLMGQWKEPRWLHIMSDQMMLFHSFISTKISLWKAQNRQWLIQINKPIRLISKSKELPSGIGTFSEAEVIGTVYRSHDYMIKVQK